MISRVLAEESIERDRFDPTELIKMCNAEAWRRLESSASSLDKKITDEFDIPSKNNGQLDVSTVGESNATT